MSDTTPIQGSADGEAAELEELWEASLSQNLDRAARIAEAAASVAQGDGTEQLRQDAQRAAHQLVGVGGSLGHPRVSTLSREANDLLREEHPLTEQARRRLTELASELHVEMAGLPVQATPATAESHRSGAAARTAPAYRNPLLLVASRDLSVAQALDAEAPRHGLRIQGVHNFDELLAVLTTGDPDAIILDDAFGADTLGTVPLLRELRERSPGLPTVVLSAEDNLQTRVAFGRAGARLLLRAGLSAGEILTSTRGLLGQLFLAVGASVLAVDDDPQILAALTILLQEHGLRATTLDDPRLFLDVLEQATPDLVLLDVDMPEINGVDLCSVLRMDLRWRHLPVVFLTASTDSGTVERLFMAGGDDYISKPVQGRELIARLEYRLARSRRPIVLSAPQSQVARLERPTTRNYPWRLISALGIVTVTLTVLVLVIFVLVRALFR